MTGLADVCRFYALLDELRDRVRGPRLLRECDGRQGWPPRGVYFFFEPGDERASSGTGPRVVRVGTHALTASSNHVDERYDPRFLEPFAHAVSATGLVG